MIAAARPLTILCRPAAWVALWRKIGVMAVQNGGQGAQAYL
jgi:hypothetical protein